MKQQFNKRFKELNIGLTKRSKVFDEHYLTLYIDGKIAEQNIFTYAIDKDGKVSFIVGHDPMDFIVGLPYKIAKITGNTMPKEQVANPQKYNEGYGWSVSYSFSSREWTPNFINQQSTANMISNHTAAVKICRELNRSALIKGIINAMAEEGSND